uniref:Integrase catalytic domain-containing protein n=1 Tax=Tanacetum cinerariifolium TaxID=118510 RepID=A0A6L2MQW5_TANCI|nr:hypothetical protein [Tanacetum cinerariifolium]
MLANKRRGKPVAAYVLQMKEYVDQLERLSYMLPQDLIVGLILNGLTKDFTGFVRNYNMHNMRKTIGELHAMFIEYDKGLPRKAKTPQVMMIKGGKLQKSKKKSLKAKGKGKANGKGNDKQVYIPKPKNPKPAAKEHPAKDDACHHCKEVVLQGFREARKLKQGSLYLYVGNGVRAQVEEIESFDLVLPNGLDFNGICEIDMHDLVPTVNSIYNVGTRRAKHNLDSTYLWHCRLAHISKKRIGKLQQEGILRSTDDESFDQSVSCLSGKMTRKSFPHRPERANDLLGIIHTNVCGPFRHVSRQDRGGEYISQEFKYYLKACGIIQQLTPPYTPQHNGVSERRNRTLLDMVRSMMNLKTLPLSFWDYALESATRILNMVPTKKVDKTPYELWYEKVSNLSYLKVWGCEALVKRDTPDKLQHQQRSVKCVFIGYPKETMGYYFYFPSENKIVVARYAEFFEKNLITQEVSRRAVDLEEIQDEDTSPSEITSEIPMVVEGFEPPQEEVIPIRRSERTHRAPNRLCLNVEVEEHSLGDLNEPASYKAAMLDSKSNKWIDAMNAKIQSMIDNMVWILVDLPPGCKTVGSKWIFKKKTDMDGFVDPNHPRKVCKLQRSIYGLKQASRSWNKIFDEEIKKFGFAQNFDEYQKSSGSNVTFLILDRSKRLIRLGQNAYMDKILKRYKMDSSKRGHIPMQEKLDLNKTQGALTPKEVKHMQNVHYASAVGSIMYAVRCTRPDVAFAQNITSRFQQISDECHWIAVKNILKYLRNTKDWFLVYG